MWQQKLRLWQELASHFAILTHQFIITVTDFVAKLDCQICRTQSFFTRLLLHGQWNPGPQTVVQLLFVHAFEIEMCTTCQAFDVLQTDY
jgi:hypothetical protein